MEFQDFPAEVYMPLYRIVIQRSFEVEIQAESQDKASQLAETYLGYHDDSNEQERVINSFSIRTIDLLENAVIDVKNIDNKGV